MHKKLFLATAMCFIAFITLAQSDGPTYISESLYLNPKMGHAQELEKAIAVHNTKFHPAGDFEAMLRYVDYGNKAGWYVWIMKGTYASLDGRPNDDGHTGDWAKTVEPHIQEYGVTTIWEFNEAMSTGVEAMNAAPRYRAWAIDLKAGQYYRFKAIMDKIVKTYESMGKSMAIYDNAIAMKDAPDVAIVWPFTSFTEFDEDNNTVEAYEKLYGKGSWITFLNEWEDIYVSLDEEIRSKM